MAEIFPGQNILICHFEEEGEKGGGRGQREEIPDLPLWDLALFRAVQPVLLKVRN